ncbi:MAG: hypothetical protein HOI31_15225 [Gammaproteobacteria bacterium]|mgnify:CR=1 FL=1|nr:hypothetical protein [Gammaproteobacteria bacterium]MBT5747643.1 hypothetical protein [Gammaproteobacteria bacterium]MBT8007926.1 hypothetical protein [Gammaproteobacteria bacterium]
MCHSQSKKPLRCVEALYTAVEADKGVLLGRENMRKLTGKLNKKFRYEGLPFAASNRGEEYVPNFKLINGVKKQKDRAKKDAKYFSKSLDRDEAIGLPGNLSRMSKAELAQIATDRYGLDPVEK